ncbi:hypothetical protein BC827DRAFT_1374770 [Russula dissimulans]|nr:hypothetical protein BC827DRAFT_1374770 [Russula dissimulans]
MVNFGDPVVILQCVAILQKFWHTICGLYVWEFITTLGYELDILRGRRPYRWTIWIYSFTRVATLVAVILNFVALDIMTPIDCQVWLPFELIFSYLGVSAASLLIIFRIFAIWNKDRVVVTISAVVWIVSVVFIIQGIARTRSAWNSDVQTCALLNSESNKLNVTVTLIADVILLLIVLIGLFRLRREGVGRSGIGLLLWNQGVIWLILATIAEVPPTVLLILNLNEPLNLMFQLPAMITLSIAATRMHRSLTDFVFGSTDIFSPGSLPIHNNRATNGKPKPSVPMSHSRIEVAVNTACEQLPMSDGSLGSTDSPGQLVSEKPHGLGLDNDLESAAPGHGGGTRVCIETG